MLIWYPVVFFSGILTVLSPCVLPILPIILSTGIDGKRSRIYGTIVGLVASFTFFALSLSSIVGLLHIGADTLRVVAAVILGLFGLSLIFSRVWESIQTRLEGVLPSPGASKHGDGFKGGLLTGAVLGLVWTPCVGPIIATVTTLAALQGFSLALAVLLFVYALGVGVTLLAVALGGAKVVGRLGWYKRNQEQVRRVFGGVILATAVLIGTGGEKKFQSWVLDNLPEQIANPVGMFEKRFSIDKEIREEMKMDKPTPGANEEVVRDVRLSVLEKGAKVPLSELRQGCLGGQDCIKSIDKPVFETVTDANTWLNERDRVFVLTFNGQTKAYPQRIMNRHEIVNDWYGKTPIAVTFCPLCGTSTAFERRVDGVITQFGVSGKLHNSDLVMYDRYEGNLWGQVTGMAIVGEAAQRDEVLEPLFLVTLDWRQVKLKFPQAEMLSRDTGISSRAYNEYPYGTYESDTEIYFPVDGLDSRLHPKTWVHGVVINGEAKAYKEEDLIPAGFTLQDTVGGDEIEIRNDDDVISFKNITTGEEVVALRSFWFAWAAFNPDTVLYEN